MNCSELKFRRGTATYEHIVAHLLGCADSFSPPLYTYVAVEQYARKILEHTVTFEAWAGTKLGGLVAVYFNNRETRVGFITNVSVLEEYHGRGIAARLMQEAIEYGRTHGFVRVDLEVGADSPRAQRLYDSSGFVVVERGPEKLLMSRKIPARR